MEPSSGNQVINTSDTSQAAWLLQSQYQTSGTGGNNDVIQPSICNEHTPSSSTRLRSGLVGSLLGLLDLLCMLPLDVLQRAFVTSDTEQPRPPLAGLRSACRQARQLCNSLATHLCVEVSAGKQAVAETAAKAKWLSSLQGLVYLKLSGKVSSNHLASLDEKWLVPFFTFWSPGSSCINMLVMHHFSNMSYGTFSMVASTFPQLPELELFECAVDKDFSFMPLAACQHLSSMAMHAFDVGTVSKSAFESLTSISSLRCLSIRIDGDTPEDPEEADFDCGCLTGLTQLTSLALDMGGGPVGAIELAVLTGLRALKLPEYFFEENNIDEIVSGMADLEALRVPRLDWQLINTLGSNCHKLKDIETNFLVTSRNATEPVPIMDGLPVLSTLDTLHIIGPVRIERCSSVLLTLPPSAQLHISALLVSFVDFTSLDQLASAAACVLNRCLPTEDGIYVALDFSTQHSYSTEEWFGCLPESRLVSDVKLTHAIKLSSACLELLCTRFPAMKRLSLDECMCEGSWAVALASLLSASSLTEVKFDSCHGLDSATLNIFSYLHPSLCLRISGTHVDGTEFSILSEQQKCALKEAFSSVGVIG